MRCGVLLLRLGRRRGRRASLLREPRKPQRGRLRRILLPACSGYLSALVVFVLPMVLVIVGMIVGSALEQGSGRDMPTLIGAAVGFALAIGIAVLVNKTITGEGNFEVERITEEEAREALQGGSSCSTAPE